MCVFSLQVSNHWISEDVVHVQDGFLLPMSVCVIFRISLNVGRFQVDRKLPNGEFICKSRIVISLG